MSLRLTDHKVLTFDCYGTLIDWESGIWDAFQPVLMANKRSDIDRTLGLACFAEQETAAERDTPSKPYPELMTTVHANMAGALGLKTSSEMDASFGHSVPSWPAFPDTADALRILKRHFKLVILSNVNRAGFAASNTKLGVEFDAIYTAEDVGSYKPAPANFEYMLEHLKSDLGLDAKDVLHTAQSLHHDHAMARQIGLANTWIDRQRLSAGGDWGATAKIDSVPEMSFIFFSMQEMADAVLAEV